MRSWVRLSSSNAELGACFGWSPSLVLVDGLDARNKRGQDGSIDRSDW